MKPYPIDLVSVVIPVYNEEASLPELLRRTEAACLELGRAFEIVLVDDGSRDRSAELLQAAAERDGSAVVAVILNRNYGQHAAILAGFEQSRGDLVITLDADLQNPPEEIPRLVERAAQGYDVVGSIRAERQDSAWRRWPSRLVNLAVQRSTGVAMHDYGCMLRAYRRSIVEAMLACRERSTFIPILANGFARHTCEIRVAHAERAHGESKYSAMRLLNLMFDLVTCMTTTPLRLLSLVGGGMALAGFLFALFLLVLRLAFGAAWAGNGLFVLFAVLFMFSGVQLLGMGLLGEYLGRMYSDVRARPRFFIERVVRATPSALPSALQRAGFTLFIQRAFHAMTSKAVVFAYHDIGCTGIEALLNAGYEIAAVFTHADDPRENTFYASVARLCAERGIPLHAPEDVNHPLWLERIRQLRPDFLFSFYYRRLLGAELLACAARGAYNLHGSLLPRYRGRAPANWVLVNGETQTGVTLHRMIERADAGPILAQQAVAIDPEDTALSLHGKLRKAAGALLRDSLPLLALGVLPEVEQDESQASHFGRRTPADGLLDWHRPARQLYDLVRAVTQPYPGAFCQVGEQKLIVWSAEVVAGNHGREPGSVLSCDPLRIACGEDSLVLRFGQRGERGLYLAGTQLATELGLVEGARLRGAASGPQRRTRVLILGVNGFIGNHLSERLLRDGRYEVHGMDIGSDAIERLKADPHFHFVEGDIGIHSEWLEYHVKKCDVVLPLVAIATPIEYTRNPLRVFELDFEENLRIVRYCVKYGKRVVFPSTSEVYGMCQDPDFDEDRSNLVVGPINKQRWIYSVSKQLLDRVIWAYGQQGLRFTLFRPFNWMGPRLDRLDSARIGSSRAITQLILHLVEGTPIRLVDGGAQKRCFTDVDDGIEALARIIDNRDGRCDGQIVNIGNPDNEASIRQLGEELLRQFEAHPLRAQFPPFAGFREVESRSFYGDGYQDVAHRKPSIDNARRLLDWQPTIELRETIGKTLDFFLHEALREREAQA